MTALPTEVVTTDHKLQKATDELAKLRWHWTLDETNSDRVGFREYARQVGVQYSAVTRMANGYAAWLAAGGEDHVVFTPGQPQTVDDHIQLAKMGGERQEAVKAVAKVTGASISNVAAHKRQEVDNVVNTARERAVDRGTTVSHEIERAAEWREKSRQAAEREADEARAAKTMAYVAIEGDLAAMLQRGRGALSKAKAAELTPELKELLADSLGKLRAILNLMDLLITDEVEINWDAEFEKLVN